MPLVLLAFGALLFVVGVYAVITGYPIVQVEKGWTSVIAGATLITGGAISMALALVLRTLQQLRSDFRAGTATAAVAMSAEPASASETLSDPTLSVLEPASVPSQKPDAVLPERDDIFHDERQHVDDIQLGETSPSVVEPPSVTSGADHLPAPEPKPATPRRPVLSRLLPSRPPSPPKPPETPALDRGVDHLEPAFAEPSSPPPHEDDWLDRILAEGSDHGRTADPHRHIDEASEPAVATAQAMSSPVEAHPAAAPEPPPPLPVEPSPAPSAPPPELTGGADATVIGRYESDGTSYVMYADGSIEAHTDSGVYRFASMAELKTFIER